MKLGRTLALLLIVLCLVAVGIYLASLHSGFGVR
jgi:hypothetical protein